MKRSVYSLIILIAVFAMALFAVSCSDDSDGEYIPVPDGDSSTDDQDEVVDGEYSEYEGAKCDIECVTAIGEYCNPYTRQCEMISCRPCKDDRNCYEGKKCIDPTTIDGENPNDGMKFCASECEVASQCDAGFNCVSGRCIPTAVCQNNTVGALPGAPCEFGPDIWPGRVCAAGDTCVGINEMGVTCSTTLDCATSPDLAGYSDIAYCKADGSCAVAGCVTPCLLNGECPSMEGEIKLCSGSVSGNCYCDTGILFPCPGEQGIGEACEFGSVNAGQGMGCVQGLNCLGIAADNTTDDCTTALDCPESPWGPNAACVSDHCGMSVCSIECNDDGTCPEVDGVATYKMNAGSMCYCTLEPYGDPASTPTDGDEADGDEAVDGDVEVDGDVAPDGDVEVDGDVAVDGDVEVDGDVAVDGDVEVEIEAEVEAEIEVEVEVEAI